MNSVAKLLRRILPLPDFSIRKRRAHRHLRHTEALEDRTLLTTITVTTAASSGVGSLNNSVILANTLGGADTIEFDPSLAGETITLNSTIPILGELTINGLGADQLTISGNNSTGIFFISDEDSGTKVPVEINGLTMTAAINSAIRNNEDLTVRDVVISHSDASRGGGIDTAGPLTVINSTIHSNTAEEGGGIYVAHGDVMILQSTISGNDGNSIGGGIQLDGNALFPSSLTVIQSTITGNGAGEGGPGILDHGFGLGTASIEIRNSIVAGNTDGFDSNPNQIVILSPITPVIEDSIVQNDATGILSPLLANNGGPFLTHALVEDSPAIDAGDDMTATDAGLIFDQRGDGFDRILGDAVDIGAVESPGSAPDDAPRQIVTPAESVIEVVQNTGFNVVANYSTSDDDSTLSGLGLRLHYDSSVMTFNRLTSVLETDLVRQQVLDDVTNYDGDSRTDKFLLVGWSDLQGNWPSQPLPTELYTANFQLVEDLAPDVTTTMLFTSSSTPVTHGFSAESIDVSLIEANLDIDNNGSADALSDGVLILRYLFGFRGDALIDNAVAVDANRTDPDEIANYLAAIAPSILDVDASGDSNALTDGTLILRYLLGFRGEDLVADVGDPDANRIDAAELVRYLNQFNPLPQPVNSPVAQSDTSREIRQFIDTTVSQTVDFPGGPLQPGQPLIPGNLEVTLDYRGGERGVFSTLIEDETLPGLGFRMHYNSSLLEFEGQAVPSFSLPYIEFGSRQELDDVEDFDNDPLTDKYVLFAFFDLHGQFPGEGTFPAELFTASFDALAQNFTTDINYTATATAQGGRLSAASTQIRVADSVLNEWTGTSGGLWNDAANWSAGFLPRPIDDVMINVAGINAEILLPDGGVTVNSIISDETLIIGDTFNVRDAAELRGVEIDDDGTLHVGGDLTITGGQVVNSGQLSAQRQIVVSGGAVLQNLSTGLLQIPQTDDGEPEDSGFVITDGSLVQNAGLLELAGISQFMISGSSTFENLVGSSLRIIPDDSKPQHEIVITDGSLVRNEGITQLEGLTEFRVSVGSTFLNQPTGTVDARFLDRDEGEPFHPIVITEQSSLRNAGQLRIEGVDDFMVSAGSTVLNLNDDSVMEIAMRARRDGEPFHPIVITDESLLQNRGNLELRNVEKLTVAAGSILDLQQGGISRLLFDQSDVEGFEPDFDFTGNSRLRNAGLLEIVGVENVSFTGANFENLPTATASLSFIDVDGFEPDFDMTGGSLRNAGNVELQNLVNVTIAGTSTIDNQAGGTLRVLPAPESFGTPPAHITIGETSLLQNAGNLELQNLETLTLSGASTIDNQVGGTLRFGTPPLEEGTPPVEHIVISETSLLQNAGNLELQNLETLTLSGASTIDNQVGGTLRFGQPPVHGGIPPTHGIMINEASLLQNAGTVTTNGIVTVSGVGDFLNQGEVRVLDEVLSIANGSSNGRFQISTGAAVNFTGSFFMEQGNIFSGLGRVLIDPAIATDDFVSIASDLRIPNLQLGQFGTLQILDGTTTLTGTGFAAGTFQLAELAELNFAGNFTMQAGSQIVGTGLVRVDPLISGSVLRIDTDLSLDQFQRGPLADVRMTGSISTSGDVVVSGGQVLGGTGTVGGTVFNSSIIRPGFSPGALTIDGDYHQESDGTLEIEIAGLNAGTEHDQLNITGTAFLDGTLELILIDDFVPELNDEFTIMTFADRQGDFSQVNVVSSNSETKFQLVYDATSLKVIARDNVPIISGISNSGSELGSVREGQSVSVSADFADFTATGPVSAVIDWGDGTTTSATSDTSESGSATGSHTYSQGGIYTITVTLTDEDGVPVSEETTAHISGAGVVDGVLQVIGTNGSDSIRLRQLRRGRIRVTGNVFSSGRRRDFNLSEIDSYLIMLGNGSDNATLARNVSLPGLIVGGDGNDNINGGTGREVLIGGEGSDRVGSRGGEDILIAGSTTFDEQQPALSAILDEWTSSRDQPTRIENVEGIGTGPRLNENFFLLLGSTVNPGNSSDQILGNDDDWIFAN